MLKVCHIISGDLWAGAEAVAYQLIKGLKKYTDIKLSVILLNEGKLSRKTRELGTNTTVVDESNNSFFKIVRTVRNELKDIAPDIIHSHRYKENILAFSVSWFLKNTKLIATQHGMPEVYGGRPSLKNRLISRFNFYILSHKFDRVVCVSGDIKKNFLNEFGFKNDTLCMIRNGIEVPDNRPRTRNVNHFVIGSSGRLFPIKDYPLMVEIGRAVKKRSGKVRFSLAGDGPELPKLQRLIKQYNFGDVFTLKGHLDEITCYYRELDLYLNTSIHEGIPVSILEAMGHGLPVIAPRVGGITEIIESGVDGYLVDSRNPLDFAEKCIYLSENIALSEKMGNLAREKVIQKFSLDTMAKGYKKLYFETAIGY